MILLLRPIIFSFVKSDAVKKLVIDILTRLAQETDNDLDDAAVLHLKSILKV